ncbi:hypothetical protein QMO56_06230 [Roseomonas sp. E05]|uniref:hypothetical protein n=1 Tax=Roseomonas sp. E05 TaxID=3046310 RepID=UPI0024BB0F61|nr:hypothetical protein [Roseomonas sp. E05]MDJ0387704.1 hypothetical protein [Roseomonas sp. E05]
MPRRFAGWLLDPADRASLLSARPAVYPRILAHHVTLRFGVPAGFPLPRETEGFVVGLADDGAGIQALVLEIGGTTSRPDGLTYHITWSLAAGRRPVESNAVLQEHGWTPLGRRRVRLEPRLFLSPARPRP